MPPYVPMPAILSLEPRRLVLVPLRCFYCGHSVPEDICEWRIHHLFGLYHCPAHAGAAERDCREFMRTQGVVRICDARQHPVLGAFLTALGSTIPVLRSSGEIDMNWYIPMVDELPIIRRSRTMGAWGFNLTNGISDKFVPLSQFCDPRIYPLLKEEVRQLLPSVETLLTAGFYG
jgi:hypothetical protein